MGNWYLQENNALYDQNYILYVIGVATRNVVLEDNFGSDQNSWVLRNTGEFFFNSMSIGKIDGKIEEGDVIVRIENFTKLRLCFAIYNFCLQFCRESVLTI
jgi:hypothetical protein